MSKETASREATGCPGCGQTFAFLPFHVSHCTSLSSSTAQKITRQEPVSAVGQTAKKRGH